MNSGKSGPRRRPPWALAASLIAISVIVPARAQDASVANRQVPASAGANAGPAVADGVPATTPLTDLLTRMDALEAQVARLTAQNEEMANRQHQLELKLAPADSNAGSAAGSTASTGASAGAPMAAASVPVAPTTQSATATNLSAMTAGASDRPAAAHTGSAQPTAQRIAAVKAVIKPQTGDAGLDEYSYGFRLYTAKFYPEAAQQLKIYIDKYPQDAHISQARNLLGRAYLDDGKPRDAAPWFLLNYKTDPQGVRAADSLLNLAEAMRQSGYDSRACIALNEFATTYAAETKGRLHEQYTKTRGGLTCS